MTKNSKKLVRLAVPVRKNRKRRLRPRKSFQGWKLKVYDSSEPAVMNVALKE